MVKNENIVQLVAHVPKELGEHFRDLCRSRKQPQKDVLITLVKLWIEFPTELQAHLLDESPGATCFVELVQQIVQSQLSAFRSALTPAQRKIVDKKLKETAEKIAQKK